MDPELVRKLLELERRLDNLQLPEIGAQPVFLTEPYTNTDFDGDSFSTVGAHTKIENTSWSTAVPTNAKALIVQGTVRDSGSAANAALYFELYSTAAATNAAVIFWCGGLANDSIGGCVGTVPCTEGDLWYRCTASGANTLDVWLRVVGYWL